MASKVIWSVSLGPKKIKVLATVILAVLGVIGSPDRIWMPILAIFCGFVIVLLEFMSHRRESNRLGRSHEIVLGRVLNLIADLSDMSARKFDLWVVDLYLPRRPLLRKQVRELELSLHISLADVRTVSNKIELDHKFFGFCFREHLSELWWDPALVPSTKENRWERLEDSDNNQIRAEYGVISVNPVIDNLREDCRGLLVVHAARDSEIATNVLTVLTHPEGKRRVAAACVDIHNYLRTS